MRSEACNLSVIIVNWNTRDLLAACLASLEDGRGEKDEADRPSLGSPAPSPDTEVIVVDNASADGSAAMVREHFPHVHLIENTENAGFARANNQGLNAASGRYVALLNSDTEVRARALETLVAFMDAQPRAGACGPRLLNSDGSLQPSCHPMLTPEREFWRLLFLDRLVPRATYPMHRWAATTPRRVEVIKGACLLLRRTALDEVGLLDASYFMYTEEVDLCHRLALMGWELWWEPRASVVHHGEASSQQMRDAMYIQLYRSKLQFYRKFVGEAEAARYKRLLRLAYGPRWIIAAAGGAFSANLRRQARQFQRLLAELPTL